LTRVRDCLGHSIGLSRNTLGHLTDLDDPDLGRWRFTYQPNGEVRTRTDQQGQTITFWYDDRNRVTSKVYANESPAEADVSYTYDSATNGKGRLYQVTKGNVTTAYNAYDDMGRVTRKTVTIDGSNYVFTYTYDAAGNLTQDQRP
jgi:YD repeat-containing protein